MAKHVHIDAGLYAYSLIGVPPIIEHELRGLYGNNLSNRLQPADFTLQVRPTSLLRRVIKKQSALFFDRHRIFNPVPTHSLLPSIEWAMNWCVASFEYTRLIIHASVAVKNNKAIVFPAQQGSGKSTLASFLGCHGWQIFSDEMAIIDLDSNKVMATYRPASLKNDSIEIVSQFKGQRYISQRTSGTQKGDIAHVRLSGDKGESHVGVNGADIKAVISPKYVQNEGFSFKHVTKITGIGQLIQNSFNFSVIGKPAFDCVMSIARDADFFYARYPDYSDLMPILEEIVED